MCDRYSTRYGYICDSCFGELVALGIETDIKEFMSLEPNKVAGYEPQNPYDKFDEEFPFG